MKIYVEDQTYCVPEGYSLGAWLTAQLLHQRKGMAIAVNDTVVPKEKWPATLLKEDDHITIIQATAGG